MNRLLFIFVLLLNHCLLFGTAKDCIFKEYDIRGIVGEEFDIEDTYEIGCAIATYFQDKNSELKSIFVGADGRVHSPLIKKQIMQALLDRGYDVIDIGTCTTPVLYFALHQVEEPQAGLIITASHNPGQYNGLKMCLGRQLISSDAIQTIRRIYNEKAFSLISSTPGKTVAADMITEYVNYMADSFPHLIGKDFNPIIDCGNGAAGTVLPALIAKMQWNQVKLLYAEVDGTYPNHTADPTVEKYMADLKRELANSDAGFGLGFDGDADRMAPMTKAGRLIKGDQLLGLYSKNILKNYPGSTIVFDVSSSKSIFDVIKKRGGVPAIAATGVANIKNKMAETEAVLGGEMSCHTIFKDRYFGYDDGIYSMLRLFELLQETQRTLDELMADFPPAFSSPTYRLPCDKATCHIIVGELKGWLAEQEGAEIITIDGLRVHFPYGWAIVRASNTEPVISMRFEGDSPETLNLIKKDFYPIISKYIDCSAFFN